MTEVVYMLHYSLTSGGRGIGNRRHLSIISRIRSFTTCFSAVAEALPLTSRVYLNNKNKSKCLINRGVLIYFWCLIRPLVTILIITVLMFFVYSLSSRKSVIVFPKGSQTPKLKLNTPFLQNVWFCFLCSIRLSQDSSEAPKMKPNGQ